MGVCYSLVNRTRRELIVFAHIPAHKKRELAGNPISAAVTTWYLLEHRGDQIGFVSDEDGDWPFETGSAIELSGYAEVTERVVEQLIEAGVIEDHGFGWSDPDEPESVYIRDLRSIWASGD